MDKREIERIVATYFGFTPAQRLPRDVTVEVVDVDDAEHSGEMEELKKLKIKWDNHIGAETKVARLTPLDILHYLHLEPSDENYDRAVNILKALAKKNNLTLVKAGERYLLINWRRRG